MGKSGGAAADEAEFREFVIGSQRRMIRFAELLTRDPVRAEDLAQHGYAQAYAAWNRIRVGDPASYVRRCIVNAHADWWRRRSWRESPSADAAGHQWVSNGSDRHAERDLVLRALAHLTVRERAVLALRYYCDLTEAQIADELGIRAGTVKSTADRALAKLREDAVLREEAHR